MAAKILKGSNDIALGDFRGEIEILRRVHHPNAVQVRCCCGVCLISVPACASLDWQRDACVVLTAVS